MKITSLYDLLCARWFNLPYHNRIYSEARAHFVDFFDFDISDVVFLCEAECLPIVVVLENVSDRGASVRIHRINAMRYISSEGMSRYTRYMNG